jgi:hypothetical protein
MFGFDLHGFELPGCWAPEVTTEENGKSAGDRRIESDCNRIDFVAVGIFGSLCRDEAGSTVALGETKALVDLTSLDAAWD